MILQIRGLRVLIDADIATLYGIETRALLQAVKRNHERFPADFMFQLTDQEAANLRSQFVISSSRARPRAEGGHGGRRTRPLAFTEQGVAMLSSILRSPRAVRVNIAIMRAFVRVRQILATHADLARRLDALERKYDGQFKGVFDAIRHLLAAEDSKHAPEPARTIGFRHAAPREKASARSQRRRVARAERAARRSRLR
ncbi:MAG: ORF6N domain-containing protein [Planctomycetes bacterium]|nr:ORF6N domain-containing protein [Planctomycetota bacterium]